MRQSQYYGSTGTRGSLDKAVRSFSFSILESQPNNQPQGSISASIGGQATQVATVLATGVLISLVAGKASDVGTLKGAGKLSSSFSRSASVSGIGQVSQAQAPSPISAFVLRQAQVGSTPKASGVLLGSVSGKASLIGPLKGTALLSAPLTGHVSSSDTVKGAGRLVAPVVGHSTDSGTLKGSTHLLSSFSGHALASGLLQGSAHLSSSIVKQATVSSGGQSSTHLSGSFSGHSSLTGLLKGIGNIFSSVVHRASVGSVLQEFEAFGSAIFGRASVSGTLKGVGRLISLTVGQHNISAIPYIPISVPSLPLSAGINGRSQVLCFSLIPLVAPMSGVVNSTSGQFKGTTVQTAFVGCNTSPVNQSDLIQVIGRGGKIIWRIDYQGNAQYNPVNYTAGAVLGRFFGNSIHDVLGLLAHQDLISVYNNGNCIWRVDSSGNVFRYTP